jgi:type IV pilus assembly protein PilP
LTPGDESTFAYQLDGRRDPFVPFITEQAATAKVDMNEIVDENKPLTGMQLFEPGQLTLVALLMLGEQDSAMVEDFTGKGYVLTEGTKIGKRGVVKDIAPNKVIIEETAVTRAGKKIITELVMTLKKEGEE